MVSVLLYIFHLQVLTQRSIAFPFQLFPNDKGRFQSIGLDSLAGMFTLAGYLGLRKSKTPPVPSLLSNPRKNAPWKLPSTLLPKSTGIVGFLLLVQAYFFTGRFSIFWEDVFYAAAGVGFPLTIAMHRSLCVLMGHMTWVAIGSLILRIVPRPQPFFGGGYEYVPETEEDSDNVDDGNALDDTSFKRVKRPRKHKWFTSTWQTNWLWWTIGGYFVSSWMFNIADFINQVVLPPEILEATAEGVVAQLINPEHNDLAASIVGCIAPCISAPWWEEVLYRGFMLPAMCLHVPFWVSVLLSGIVFSAHHLSATGAIPLAILGWTWAAIYAKSGNLLVTILIHAMWNSRVFLGSWLGL
jgi:membrane protease YdiL (CAAX protease family)